SGMRDDMAVGGDRPERLEERAATCVAPMHRVGAAARVVPTRTPPLHSRRWRSRLAIAHDRAAVRLARAPLRNDSLPPSTAPETPGRSPRSGPRPDQVG